MKGLPTLTLPLGIAQSKLDFFIGPGPREWFMASIFAEDLQRRRRIQVVFDDATRGRKQPVRALIVTHFLKTGYVATSRHSKGHC